jgi:hypothetical protein
VTLRTVGISRKLLAAVWGACGAQAIALVTNLIASGQFDRVELAQVIGVAATAAGGVLAGYWAAPDSQREA